ncbi:MAG: 1-acyl-sn-glycerol-3-phosphate acyltransferase [Cyanobacteria bacterium HKST-UBA02]|nr:1-acyl-sn-glycerol-3-phosphate acyltransferase [Cyanobacteria bacterium HKST-UBA02]
MYSQRIETGSFSRGRHLTELSAGIARRVFGLTETCPDVASQEKPRIYFSNHTSHLDFLLLWSVLPVELRRNTVAAAAADYWCSNVFRRWVAGHLFHAIMIERHDISRDNNPITLVIEELDRGHSVIIFPEGGRSEGPEIAELKSGLYHIARRRPDIELVPAFIHNANRALPKGQSLPIPLICSVSFGTPMRLMPGESKGDFVARARQELERCRAA